MGEAARKKKLGIAPAPRPSDEVIERCAQQVWARLKELDTAEGGDCIPTALLMADALKAEDIKAKPVIGYAAWRVGPGAGDMVGHHPSVISQVMPDGSEEMGFMGHAWVQVGYWIIDITTRDLPSKLAGIDAFDGRKSHCLWWSPITVIERKKCKTLWHTQQDYDSGCYYEERLELHHYLAIERMKLNVSPGGVIVISDAR